MIYSSTTHFWWHWTKNSMGGTSRCHCSSVHSSLLLEGFYLVLSFGLSRSYFLFNQSIMHHNICNSCCCYSFIVCGIRYISSQTDMQAKKVAQIPPVRCKNQRPCWQDMIRHRDKEQWRLMHTDSSFWWTISGLGRHISSMFMEAFWRMSAKGLFWV